jgi:hypothetical protein
MKKLYTKTTKLTRRCPVSEDNFIIYLQNMCENTIGILYEVKRMSSVETMSIIHPSVTWY